MKIKNKLFLGLAMLSLLSCSDLVSTEDLPDNMVYISSNGVSSHTLYNMAEPNEIVLSVIRSGIHDRAGVATVDVVPSELTKYNERMATNYEVLPAEYYTFTKTDVTIAADKVYGNFSLSVNTPKLYELGEDLDNYVIPIGVTSSSFEISEEVKNNFLTFSVRDAIVSMDVFGETIVEPDDETLLKISIPVSIPFDNNWGLSCNFLYGEEQFNAYNESVGNIYESIPAEAISVSEMPLVLDIGQKNKTLQVTIDKSKLGGSNYAFVLNLNNIESEKIILPDPEKNQYVALIPNAADLSTAGWVAMASATESYEGSLDGVLDGQLNTYWHSPWSDATVSRTGQWVGADMGKVYKITAIKIAPRSAAGSHLNSGYIETSVDGTTWENVGEYSVAGAHELQTFLVKPSEARYFRIYCMNNYGQISEIGAQGGDVE